MSQERAAYRSAEGHEAGEDARFEAAERLENNAVASMIRVIECADVATRVALATPLVDVELTASEADCIFDHLLLDLRQDLAKACDL